MADPAAIIAERLSDVVELLEEILSELRAGRSSTPHAHDQGAAFLRALSDSYGGEPFTAAELQTWFEAHGYPTRRVVRAAALALVDEPTPRRLGVAFARLADRGALDGLQLQRAGARDGAGLWRVVRLDDGD